MLFCENLLPQQIIELPFSATPTWEDYPTLLEEWFQAYQSGDPVTINFIGNVTIPVITEEYTIDLEFSQDVTFS
jgi:hypothetical protein